MSVVAEYTPSAEFQMDQEPLRQVLEKSALGSEFRARLLTEPRAALAELGHAVPETLDIRFIEDEGDATILLPKPVDRETELSEVELEPAGAAIAFSTVSLSVVTTPLTPVTVRLPI